MTSKKIGQVIEPENHVLRNVKASFKLIDPETGEISILPDAFMLKRDEQGVAESGLSFNWVEFYASACLFVQIDKCINDYSTGNKPGKNSMFAYLNIGELANIYQKNGKSVQMKYFPIAQNHSHCELRGNYELDELAICTEIVNSPIKFISNLNRTQFLV